MSIEQLQKLAARLHEAESWLQRCNFWWERNPTPPNRVERDLAVQRVKDAETSYNKALRIAANQS
jgi:hypothetical protein